MIYWFDSELVYGAGYQNGGAPLRGSVSPPWILFPFDELGDRWDIT